VLPGRLNTELKEVEAILQGDSERLVKAEKNTNDSIHKHILWIKELVEKYGITCNKEEAEEVLKKEVGDKFLNVLMDAGVYKRSLEGREGFDRFMESIGFYKINN
jgi:UDPglucose--hexose-1-phosphate uridylyltransferase